MIKLVHTEILQKTVNGHVCHQLLWSYLEITIRLVFVIVPLDTKSGKGVKASAAANSFIGESYQLLVQTLTAWQAS